jgi:hypothetical protein
MQSRSIIALVATVMLMPAPSGAQESGPTRQEQRALPGQQDERDLQDRQREGGLQPLQGQGGLQQHQREARLQRRQGVRGRQDQKRRVKRQGAASWVVGQYEPDADGVQPARTAALRLTGRAFGLYGLIANIEIEAATDFREGETTTGDAFSFTSYGAYIRARTPGSLYLIGRYGFARNRLSIDGGPTSRDTQQRTGVGLGVRWGSTQIELTASRYDKTSDLPKSTWINASLRF